MTWNSIDFIIIGVLIVVTGLAFATASSKIHQFRYRVIAGIILLIVLLYIWAELAVGIFTNLGS